MKMALAAVAITALAAQPSSTFDVVAIKPAGGADGAARFGAGCDGGFPVVQNHRFVVTTTAYALITWAYGFNAQGGCSYVNYGDLLSGGPGWIRSERFEVQALMPDTAPAYTTSQFLNGAAPELETMIRNMLQDRFKLVVHRAKKDVSGYILALGKGGPKITAAKAGDAEAFGVRSLRNADGQVSSHLVVSKTKMRYVALTLGLATHRMVEDRTGLTGEYTFDMEFAPLEAGPGESSAPSLFTAVQEQLGLKLDAAKVSAEGLVIDSAARPSDN
jgi:uncharacterized protein (TIGR03435 family)